MRILRKILWFLLLLFLLLASIGVGYYLAVTKDAILQPEKLLLNEQSVVLYDRHGEEVKNVSAYLGKQTVKIDEIPKITQLAVLSVEDKRFYKHNGFDLKRIARAFLNNAKAKTFKEGASTISQQLIKNTHLSQKKTVKRKLMEWKLTRKLERSYTKSEILERYLNTIYFGHSCFGIRAAADFYFGKKTNELNLSESAILAGLIKSPNNYSPFKNEARCEKRKATVLTLMEQNGCISSAERAQAMQIPLPPKRENERVNDGFSVFVFDELGDIAQDYNLRLGGKIEIFTELDPTLQEKLNNIREKELSCDLSMMVLDAETHRFKGCVSTVGNIKRLPGSLIKPLLVYAPAMEENLLSPATHILDEAVNYSGYTPENYDGKYHGYLSARECLAKSLNVPAVKILQSIGTEKASAYTSKLGLPIAKTDYSLALALGGMQEGFPLRDIVGAYAALQDGSFYQCAFIKELRINGIRVYEHKPIKMQVFSRETAYLTTDMLKTAVQDGTAKKLRGLPCEIAAKTGTVGNAKGNTDAYALSYTAKDIAAVWMGNVDNQLFSYTGGGFPSSLLREINEGLLEEYTAKDIKVTPFQRPSGIVTAKLDKTTYYDTHNIVLADDLAPNEFCVTELFKKSNLPTKKSDFFSNPSIPIPHIETVENAVKITFSPRSSNLYRYRIERYDYATHTTVYEGEYLDTFLDKAVKTNKRYQYIVTPFYKENRGVSITLPEIYIETPKEKITQKEWWQY